jgi:hypothetical protein
MSPRRRWDGWRLRSPSGNRLAGLLAAGVGCLVVAGAVNAGVGRSDGGVGVSRMASSLPHDSVKRATSPADASLERLRRQAVARAARRQRWFDSPRVRAQRVASRMAFHGLTAVGAQGLTARVFGPSITSAGANPATTVARAGTVVGYLSDYRAIVRKPDGHLELEVSTVPLAVPGGGHAKLPVSLSLQRLGSGFATVRSAQPVSIAGSSGGGVGLSSQGVRLVSQGANVRGSLVGDKSVFFANVGRDVDVSAAPTIQGVELFDILRSKLSPEQLRYRVVMPRGAKLQAVGGGASVVLDGRELAHVPAPSARDAQGQVVPVRMAVSGDELLLTVVRRDLDVAYPLLVDPELGSSKPPGWKYYTNDSAIEGIYPAAISAGGEFRNHEWGAWLWSRPNEASFIKSLVYYGLSYSETNLTSWWAAVGSGTVYKGEHGELITNFTWWWGESSPSSPPAEVVVNKMAGGPEQSAVVVGLEATPHPTETEKGSASFSVRAILATIELNGATTTINPLGEPSTTLTPEEGYGVPPL